MVAAGSDMGVVIEPFNDDKFFKRPIYTSRSGFTRSRQHPLAAKECLFFCAQGMKISSRNAGLYVP